ncbi:hypothetical protein [Roseomonas chloroacetimidivorans]|uniref:hypothetical protein n=1 Tax=Roseomonas chloroacetimidivorans TaxID=1766656 RepID=UPI003C707006
MGEVVILRRLPLPYRAANLTRPDRAISSERYDQTIDLVEQGADQRAIIEIVAGQHERGGPAGVVIRGRISGDRAPTTLNC